MVLRLKTALLTFSASAGLTSRAEAKYRLAEIGPDFHVFRLTDWGTSPDLYLATRQLIACRTVRTDAVRLRREPRRWTGVHFQKSPRLTVVHINGQQFIPAAHFARFHVQYFASNCAPAAHCPFGESLRGAGQRSQSGYAGVQVVRATRPSTVLPAHRLGAKLKIRHATDAMAQTPRAVGFASSPQDFREIAD